MKKRILAITALVIVAVAGYAGWQLFGPAVQTPSGEFLYVNTGSNMDSLRQELVGKKFISSATWFDRASGLLRFKTVKPGRYKVTKGMSVYSLVKMLRNGNQVPVNFVVIKIRTKEDLARRTGNAFACDSAEMIAFLNNNDSLRSFGLDSNTVMAAVMPYTYSINWNSSPGRIFRQFYASYKTFWNEARTQKAEALHMTPLQVMTLASVVEEETNRKDDRYNIASVYLNRLNTGMPMQACPTVKFALKNFGLKRVLQVHTQTPSPFNTYLHKGLPPGPICTPSVESIDAVLDAPKTQYMYFVASSNFDGLTVFTTNLDDHNKYAHLYQQALDRRMDSVKRLNKE